MAKRTRTTIIRDNPDDDLSERDSIASREIEQDSGEQAYSEFMTKNRGVEGCRVRIRRQTPQGRQFCISEPPEAIESIEEYLSAYHAKQVWSTEEGVYFVSVDVHGETRSAFCIRIAPMLNSPAAAVMSGGMAVAPEVRMLQEQIRNLENRLIHSEKPPMLEMVDGLARLDQLRAGQGNGFNLDSIVKCIEIGTRMNGGGGDSGGWEGLARDVLKDNAPAIISLLQLGVNKLSAMNKPAEQAQTQPSAEPTKVEETMEPSKQELMILQQGIGYLKKKAAAHSDPGLYVDLIVDNREEPLYARLISKIVESDFPTFATIDPDIAKPEYRDFFGFIHDRIRSVFKPANTVATPGAGKSGNKGNASSNGSTGKSSGQ